MKAKEIVCYVIAGFLFFAAWHYIDSSSAPNSGNDQATSSQHVTYDSPMGRELDLDIQIINQFASDTFTHLPALREWKFVPYGLAVKTPCNNGEIAASNEMKYCPVNDTVYVGEQFMQVIYEAGGKTGFLIGVAHEFGHHIQVVGDVHDKLSEENREKQADCYAGSISEYAYQHGDVDDPLGPASAATFNLDISTNHGTHDQRLSYLTGGAKAGVSSCINMFS